MWAQVYDPFGSMPCRRSWRRLPIVVLLGAIGIFEMKAHIAALLGLGRGARRRRSSASACRRQMAGLAAVYGAAFGLLPIGWIILNVIFLYQLTNEKGEFEVLQRTIRAITDDRRLQLLFIAFCFGAFFEGAAGFGTPVAVTAAMLIGLGFSPLAASGLSLIANTAPVAYGALGTPVIALAAVTGLDLHELSGMIGRQLPFFSVHRAVLADLGLRRLPPHARGLAGVLVAGVSFARAAISRLELPRALAGRHRGRDRLDGVPCAVPARLAAGEPDDGDARRSCRRAGAASRDAAAGRDDSPAAMRRAWLPWLILSVFVFLWGTPQVSAALDGLWVGEAPRRRPARAGAEGAAGRGAAARRSGGLQSQPALGDRHRHPARRARLRPVSRLRRRRTWCACTAARSTSSATRC